MRRNLIGLLSPHVRAAVLVIVIGSVMVLPTTVRAAGDQNDRSVDAFANSLAESEHVSVETARQVISLTPAITALAEKLDSVSGFSAIWLDWGTNLVLNVSAQPGAILDVKSAIEGAQLPAILQINVLPVDRSAKELRQAQQQIIASLVAASLDTVVGVGNDYRTNSLRIEVQETDLEAVALANALAQAAGVATSVVETQQAPTILGTTLSGGGFLSSGCTSGFSLRQPGTAYKALLTAGHCVDSASQSGVTLANATNDTCGTSPPGGMTDRQTHYIPSPHSATNSVSLGGPPNPARTITSAIANNGFWNTMPMEKYGISYGYGTGSVYDIAYANTQCGGLTDLVLATTYALQGDSGGPIFMNNLALGITHGVMQSQQTAFSRIGRSTAGTGYVVCIKANCAP